MRIANRITFTAVAVLVLGSPLSAADEELMTVEGNVTLLGKPVADGTITIHLKNDQFVGCKIKDGKYRIERVPAGEFKVTIESKKLRLPQKYAGEDTSGLTVAVKKGKNAADYQLVD